MARLFFDPEPDEVLAKIEASPGLYAQVEPPLRERLRWLQNDHRDARANRVTFTGGLRYIHVPVNGEPDWAILWEEINPVDDEPAIGFRYMDLDFR